MCTILHTQLNYLTLPVTPFKIQFPCCWGDACVGDDVCKYKQFSTKDKLYEDGWIMVNCYTHYSLRGDSYIHIQGNSRKLNNFIHIYLACNVQNGSIPIRSKYNTVGKIYWIEVEIWVTENPRNYLVSWYYKRKIMASTIKFNSLN